MKFRAEIILLTLIAIIASLIYTPVPIAEAQIQDDWVIEGNSVYINDSNAYLSATPHTLGGSGWVEFEILSKNYEGEIDAVWGFDVEAGIQPSKPQLWVENLPHLEYRTIPVELEGNVTIENILSYRMLESGEADIGNANNTKLIELTLEQQDEMGYPNPLIIAFNYHVQLSETSATFYYLYDGTEQEPYINYYDDWKGITAGAITTVSQSYMDCDDWKFVKLDAPIEKNRLYKLRCWVEVPFKGHDTVSGKYIWAVKPSGETLQQAISLGHLYMLDPWYDGDWDYRETITIDHSYVNGTQLNFPVYIDEHELSATFWANVQPDGEDVVFTSDDGETKLKREMVTIDTLNETMEFHVKVPVLQDLVNTTLFIYYGNAGASEVNDTDTWDSNFKAVYHMNDGADTSHIYDSTSNDNDGTKTGANNPIEATGDIGKAQDFNGTTSYIAPIADSSLAIEDHSWTGMNTIKTTAGQGRPISLGTSGTGYANTYVHTGGQLKIDLRDDDGTGGFHTGTAGAINDGALHIVHFVVERFPATPTTRAYTYIDGVKDIDTSLTGAFGDVSATDFAISKVNYNGLVDGTMDEVRISNIARTPGWIATTNATLSQPAIFYHVGTVETPAVPTFGDMSNPEVNGTSVNLTANMTDTGYPDGDDIDEHGFVWDTSCHANPGDVAPGASGYAFSWTESGSFGVGEFTHIAEGLDELTTYCFRAYALNAAGYAYSDEMCFFVLEEGKVYIEIRPRLNQATIAKAGGIPTEVDVGIFHGWSLPIWSTPTNQYEELHLAVCVPDRWDGESDIILHIHTALASANESAHNYRLNVSWEHATPNEDVLPVTLNTIYLDRAIYSDNQYEFYVDYNNIDYNIDVGDNIEADDILTLRIRRETIGGQLADLDGELIIVHVGFMFARGDLLGTPGDIVTDDTLEGINMIIAFIGLCLGLVFIGYIWKKQAILVAAALSWIAFGFWNRTITPTWGTWDVYELLFWIGIVMGILCMAEAIVMARTPGEPLIGEQKLKESKRGLYADDYETMQDEVRKLRGQPPRKRDD